MAFDLNNPADLLALKNEVTLDPLGMGYDPDTSTARLLKQLNDAAENLGGETTGETLTIRLLLRTCVDNPDDLTVGGQFTEGALEAIKMVFEASNHIDEDIEVYRAGITAMFAANDGLRLALEAQSRGLSRAEVLFGAGTAITKNDWFAARVS